MYRYLLCLSFFEYLIVPFVSIVVQLGYFLFGLFDYIIVLSLLLLLGYNLWQTGYGLVLEIIGMILSSFLFYYVDFYY